MRLGVAIPAPCGGRIIAEIVQGRGINGRLVDRFTQRQKQGRVDSSGVGCFQPIQKPVALAAWRLRDWGASQIPADRVESVLKIDDRQIPDAAAAKQESIGDCRTRC